MGSKNDISLKALAKINLGLDVVRRREDGYHEVRMIMQTIHLYDRLDIKRTKEPGIQIQTNLSFLPVNENNLIYKAAKLLMDEFSITDGVSVKLDLPGQFIIAKTDEVGERIPLTICDYDREKETVTIVVQTIGAGTECMMALNEGDALEDFVGPLGCPSELCVPRGSLSQTSASGRSPDFAQTTACVIPEGFSKSFALRSA